MYEASHALMGSFGGLLAVLGVVVLPITSGDTAFRAARLTIAEMIRLPQLSLFKRLSIAVPLFIIGIALSQIDFGVIWRYFGWSNQTLAAIMLWASAAYLLRHGKLHWICTLPAVFITAASVSYICYQPSMGLGLSIVTSDIVGAIFAAVCLGAFLIFGRRPIAGAPTNV